MLTFNWLDLAALAGTLLFCTGLSWLKKINLDFSLLTFIGLGLGVVVGLVFPGHVVYVKLIGTIYVRIITAVVAPLILFSIFSSVTSLHNVSKLKTIGLRSVFWLLLNTLLAIVLSLAVGLLFHVGRGASLALTGVDASSLNGRVQPITSVISDFFPSNIVTDIGANSIVPIIIGTLAIAVAYLILAEENEQKVLPFKRFADAFREILFKVVDFVLGLTPYAVLALVASAVSNASKAVSSILPLLMLLAVAYILCILHTFVINGALVAIFARLSPVRFFKKIAQAQVTAFTTESSVGTLPVTVENLTQKVGVSQEITNFVAPLGTTIGMPGCAGIWPVLLAVFAIHALNLHYTVGQYVLLVVLSLAVSLGTAGVPGTATVTATAVFTAAGLPVGVIILLLPISQLADMARTATNVTGAAVSAAIVARKENQIDDAVFAGTAKPAPAEPAGPATAADGETETLADGSEVPVGSCCRR